MASNKLQLVFIVNGTPVTQEVNINQPLHAVLGAVLSAAGVPGDANMDRWEFKYNNQPLDPNKKIDEFGFPANAQIFLNLKAGVVG